MYECLLSIEVTEPTGSWFTPSASLMFSMCFYSTALCVFYYLSLKKRTLLGLHRLLCKLLYLHYIDHFILHRALECLSVKTDKALLMLMQIDIVPIMLVMYTVICLCGFVRISCGTRGSKS